MGETNQPSAANAHGILEADQVRQLDQLLVEGMDAAARARTEATDQAAHDRAQGRIQIGRALRHLLAPFILEPRTAQLDVRISDADLELEKTPGDPLAEMDLPAAWPEARSVRSCTYCGATERLRHDLDVCTDTEACNGRVMVQRAGMKS